MNKLLICAICGGLFSSCSYSLNVVQTQGEATDVLDANESFDAKADVKADIPVGLKPMCL